MSSLLRGVRRLVATGSLLFAGVTLYWAVLADVPVTRVSFTLPSGVAGDVTTPLEPMVPGRQGPLCDVGPHGLWTCTVRQSFWQNPVADHKTGSITLGLRDARDCHRADRAPRQVTVLEHPDRTVQVTALPDDGCTARYTLAVRW